MTKKAQTKKGSEKKAEPKKVSKKKPIESSLEKTLEEERKQMIKELNSKPTKEKVQKNSLSEIELAHYKNECEYINKQREIVKKASK